MASIAVVTEAPPRLRSSQRGWASNQDTTPATLPRPASPPQTSLCFGHKLQFSPLRSPSDRSPHPQSASVSTLWGQRRRKGKRPPTPPGHEATAGPRKQEVTYLPDGSRGPPGRPGGRGRALPPKPLLLLRPPLQGLTEGEGTGSNLSAQSPLAWQPGPRPAEDEAANVTPGRSPPSSLGAGEPGGGSPRRRVREGREEKALGTLNHLRGGGAPPPPSALAGLPLCVFFRPHFRRSALAHCARLGDGGRPRRRAPPLTPETRALPKARPPPAPPLPPPRRPAHFRPAAAAAAAALRLSGERAALPRPGLLSTGGSLEGNCWFSRVGSEARLAPGGSRPLEAPGCWVLMFSRSFQVMSRPRRS